MLSKSSLQKNDWLERTYETWSKATKELETDFNFTDLHSLLENNFECCGDVLAQFFHEVKKEDGSEYPPSTVGNMFRSLQMYLNENFPQRKINVKSDIEFINVRKSVNARMMALTEAGLRTPQKQAEKVSEEMETALWQNKILGDSNPGKLLRTVFFIVGKHFALRSRDEHHNLRAGATAQIRVAGMGKNCRIEYYEDMSKNNSGGVKDEKRESKLGVIYGTGCENCPVSFVKKYLSLIPANASRFYCRANKGDNPKNWYCNQPVGVNKIAEFMKDIAAEAGWDLSKHWSGHSLRASCITALYDEGFSDSVVIKMSGHRSDLALEVFKMESSMLSKSSLQKNDWLERTYERWSKATKELETDFNFTDLHSLLENNFECCGDVLAQFFQEVKKEDGSEYPPSTVGNMFRSLQMYLNENFPQRKINVKSDIEFINVRKSVNARMMALTEAGLKTPQKQAEKVSEEMETALWQKRILGDSNPRKLLRTVFFIVGKHFALRSRDEHHNLRAGATAQIRVAGMGKNCRIEYYEDMNKNNSGGVKDEKRESKLGVIYGTGCENCPVSFVKKYLSLIPANASRFYCRANKGDNPKNWYCNQPVGVNKIAEFMKDIAAEAGWDLSKHWSGHSLRASCITALYDEGFSDSVVIKMSGHRSDLALEVFKMESSMLSKSSLQKNDWLERTYERWSKATKELETDFNFTDLHSLLENNFECCGDVLAQFFQEVKKEDGSEYPPSTVGNMFRSLQMYLNENFPQRKINVKSDIEFINVRKSVNARMMALTEAGLKTPQKQAEKVSEEMETALWQKRILGDSNPRKLLRTVFFIVGKHFALRSRDEHHNLRAGATAQIRVAGMGKNCRIEYYEDMNKNNSGGVKDEKRESKLGVIYGTGCENCPVSFVKKYLSLIPANASRFYCRANKGDNPKNWYCNQPVGVNKIAEFMKDIAAEAGWDLSKHWSGHSLRASCITASYDEGYSDSVVIKMSGHRSDLALEEYQRSAKRKLEASGVLSRPSKVAAGEVEKRDDDNDASTQPYLILSGTTSENGNVV